MGVRINHNRPPDIVDVSDWPSLPELHDVELRLLTASHLSGAASTMLDILAETTVGLIDAADRRRG